MQRVGSNDALLFSRENETFVARMELKLQENVILQYQHIIIISLKLS